MPVTINDTEPAGRQQLEEEQRVEQLEKSRIVKTIVQPPCFQVLAADTEKETTSSGSGSVNGPGMVADTPVGGTSSQNPKEWPSNWPICPVCLMPMYLLDGFDKRKSHLLRCETTEYNRICNGGFRCKDKEEDHWLNTNH